MSGVPVRRIVVGVDGSAGADDALRWASAEADLHQADLTAVLAWEHLHHDHAVVADHVDPSSGAAGATEALREHLAATLGAARAATVRTSVHPGLAVRALLDATDGADLLVVGARGLGGFRGLLLGSVGQHCLHHATIPIAIIRPGALAPNRQGRIVVGVDGSAPARLALRWAIQEARARGARLDVVTTWRLPYGGAVPAAPSAFAQQPWKDEAARALDRAVSEEDVDGVEVVPVLLHHTAGGGLVDHAADADLLVVGSHGRGPFARAALGSVATQVTQHATCPVVVVPADRSAAP